jgi:hypothetical protein
MVYTESDVELAAKPLQGCGSGVANSARGQAQKRKLPELAASRDNISDLSNSR